MTYKIQIDDLVRDATEEEAAQIKAQQAKAATAAKAEADRAAKRIEVLNKLGLTEDEADALFS